MANGVRIRSEKSFLGSNYRPKFFPEKLVLLQFLRYTEVSKQCQPMDSMEMDGGTDTMSGGSGQFTDIPDFQIGGPDDLEAIQQIREFFSAQAAKRKGLQESLEQNCKENFSFLNNLIHF